jgi:hypothetical protein
VSERHVRALRDDARRARVRLAEYSIRGREGDESAAHRRADLEHSARRAAARLASAEARRRRGPDT